MLNYSNYKLCLIMMVMGTSLFASCAMPPPTLPRASSNWSNVDNEWSRSKQETKNNVVIPTKSNAQPGWGYVSPLKAQKSNNPNNDDGSTTNISGTEFVNGENTHNIPLTYHALVIGIDQYKKITKLKTAISDAQTVSSVLTNEYGFIVKTLLNPTRTEVINAISDYRKQLTAKDGLLIYYAGHGWLDKEADEGYWLPVDATEDSEANWISTSSNITASLRAMEARHVLVVADSCYSGKLTRGLVIAPKSPSEAMRLQGRKARKVIASGGLEPVADNNGKEKNSVFASAFLKALRENNQTMTATDLFSTVRTSVIRNADQTPEFGVIHKAGDDGGDFVFIKKR